MRQPWGWRTDPHLAVHLNAVHVYWDVAFTGVDEPVVVADVHVPAEHRAPHRYRLSWAPRSGGSLGGGRTRAQPQSGRRDAARKRTPRRRCASSSWCSCCFLCSSRPPELRILLCVLADFDASGDFPVVRCNRTLPVLLPIPISKYRGLALPGESSRPSSVQTGPLPLIAHVRVRWASINAQQRILKINHRTSTALSMLRRFGARAHCRRLMR